MFHYKSSPCWRVAQSKYFRIKLINVSFVFNCSLMLGFYYQVFHVWLSRFGTKLNQGAARPPSARPKSCYWAESPGGCATRNLATLWLWRLWWYLHWCIIIYYCNILYVYIYMIIDIYNIQKFYLLKTYIYIYNSPIQSCTIQSYLWKDAVMSVSYSIKYHVLSLVDITYPWSPVYKK